MSDYPYTDKQALAFARPINRFANAAMGHVHLRALHEAGITVTFPEPRYVVRSTDLPTRNDVLDTLTERHVAAFWHAESKRYAREHADRLNREADRD